MRTHIFLPFTLLIACGGVGNPTAHPDAAGVVVQFPDARLPGDASLNGDAPRAGDGPLAGDAPRAGDGPLASDAPRAGDAPRASDAPVATADARLADARTSDATPATPDAPSPPDAGSGSGCTVDRELLTNSNFDLGVTGWQTYGDDLIWSASELADNDFPAPYDGGYAAYLGGYEGADETMEQTVHIPVGAQGLRLDGWYYIINPAPVASLNTLVLSLVDADGFTVTTFHSFDDEDENTQWTGFGDTTSVLLGGETVTLRIESVNGADPSRFFLDGLSLVPTSCQ